MENGNYFADAGHDVMAADAAATGVGDSHPGCTGLAKVERCRIC